MINFNLKNFVFLVFILIFSSCVSKKDIVYFQFDEEISKELQNSEHTTVFKPGDILEIIITSTEPILVKQFNLTSSENDLKPLPYIVDNNGKIEFPVLGSIQIGGLTKEEAVKMFKEKLTLTNPGVYIKILNYNITVLGDVNKPGSYTIPNERINIIEAIGLAGDLNISGKRNNIIVKRKESEGYKYYQLDIRSKNITSSPAYYLQQNDVVYVEPNKAKLQSASANQNTGLYLSVVSLVITLITLISR